MNTRTELINLLFEKYNFKSYLEIGVQVPSRNFNKINAVLKHSVDPNPNIKYTYNMTSDEFFRNYIEKEKYDVVFIDGMHTMEQAYKDVINSIKHLNDNGFIVMHDCNPPTEHAARIYEDYLKDSTGDWYGTAFKAFLQLKHELCNYSCFVVNIDAGCGIITKRKILENKSLNNNNTWEYFDKNRKELLQLISSEEYNNIIFNDVIEELPLI